LTPEDVDGVITSANVLRTGEGKATFHNVSGMVENPQHIPSLPDEFRRAGSMRKTVTYKVFGEELALGEADYELPQLKVVSIVPYGQTPNAPARVELGADGPSEIRFRIVRAETK
jgi:hypothetical protein